MKRMMILAPLAAALAAPAAWAGTIANATVERAAPDRLVVRWTDRDPVDLLQSDRPDATAEAATLVSAKDKDGVQEVTVAPDARPYFLLRDGKSGETVRVAERVLPLEQGSNFRDVGGYATADGKHVRWGMIFRSGGQPMLTDADVKEIKSLGIANLVDLRSDEERVMAPTRLDGIRYNAIGYSMASMMAVMSKADPANPLAGLQEGYRAFPQSLAPQVRLVFAKLLSKEGPVVYNCSAGQDRTGFTTAMVLSTLGVPRDTIYADYVLSMTYRRPEWEMAPMSDELASRSPVFAYFAQAKKDPRAAKPTNLVASDGTPYLATAFKAIEDKWGSVDSYLEQEIGLTKVDIAQLRATYLE